MKRIVLILALIIVYSTASLSAVDHFVLELGTGASWVHNEAYLSVEGEKDPDPILYRFSLGFPIYFSENFFFSPGLSLWGNPWQYVESNQWAMPVDSMWQDLFVLSLNLELPIGYQFNFKTFSMAIYAGPNFNFRIPLWGDDESVRDDMLTYFLGGGRFINLTGGLIFIIPMTDKFAFTVKGESIVPIHNLWSDSNLPFSDGLAVSFSAGARFIW